MIIRSAEPRDAHSIADIYNYFVTETTVTFEEIALGTDEIVRRIENVQSFALPYLVAEEEGSVVGYTYANPWKQQRSAYRFSVEITIYVKQGCSKRGIGSTLYAQLFERLRAQGIHSVIGGIALPNDASVALHEKLGLKQVAHFREVGFKHGRWVDVGYWQLTL
jgi:phosphinothricin acetyltransferase